MNKQSELLQHITPIYVNHQHAQYAKELTDRMPGNLKVGKWSFHQALVYWVQLQDSQPKPAEVLTDRSSGDVEAGEGSQHGEMQALLSAL